MKTQQLRLLFHLLGIVLDLISSLDDLVWSAVKLVWDDSLKVLQHSKETRVRIRSTHTYKQLHTPKSQSVVSLTTKHFCRYHQVHKYNLGGYMYQLTRRGGGSSPEGAAHFTPEI